MSTETDKVILSHHTYPVHTIPKKEWKALQVQLNPEHTQLWQSCYFDNPPGDLWLIGLFANEYYYLKNGHPDDNAQLTDFSC